jgi:hypothetical protein
MPAPMGPVELQSGDIAARNPRESAPLLVARPRLLSPCFCRKKYNLVEKPKKLKKPQMF